MDCRIRLTAIDATESHCPYDWMLASLFRLKDRSQFCNGWQVTLTGFLCCLFNAIQLKYQRIAKKTKCSVRSGTTIEANGRATSGMMPLFDLY